MTSSIASHTVMWRTRKKEASWFRLSGGDDGRARQIQATERASWKEEGKER